MNKYHPLRWVIWSLAAAFYFYEFFIRVSPGVMIDELMSTFEVDATTIGDLAGIYFYIYAPMQLLVGVLTDRFGARRLLALAALGAGVGTLLFGIAQSLWMAVIGRFLMGAGSSFGFVGLIYICSHWFSIKRRGILIGLGNAFGMLGAVFGEGPLRLGINAFGWRLTMIFLAFIGILLSLLIYLLVRNEPKSFQKKASTPPPLWANLRVVIKNRFSWINAISSGFAYTVAPAFASLWGIPFLVANEGYSIETAGFAASMIFIGWGVGGPFIGRFSDRMKFKKPLLVSCYLIAALLMTGVVFIQHIPTALLFPILFLVGFFTSAQLLNYSYAIDLNPNRAKGTATAFTNFIVVAISALAQPLLGKILDLQWTGQMANGARAYSPDAYMWAVAYIPLTFFLAFILSLFLKKVRIKAQ